MKGRPLARVATIVTGVLALSACSEPVRVYDESRSLVGYVSGEFAGAHVRTITGFGPRPSGSESLQQTRDYIEAQIGELGWETTLQRAEIATPDGDREFVNLRARFGEEDWERPVRGVLLTHLDTKAFDGFESLGANEAASGAGVLLELTRVLSRRPDLAREVELVFCDGHEPLGPRLTPGDGLRGSRHYAMQMLEEPERLRPRWGILVRRVGSPNPAIRAGFRLPEEALKALREGDYAVDLDRVQGALESMSGDVLSAASDLEVRSEVGVRSGYLLDGHVPLSVVAGIPTIALVDEEESLRHSASDSAERIDSESLALAGRLLLHLVEKYSPGW